MPPQYGGLEFAGLDIQQPSIFFDVMGSLWEPAEHRGEDDVVPGKAGRYRRNRVADRRLISLRGWTRGIGGTVEERQQAWALAEEALGAILSPANDPAVLEVISPYLGLPSGSASITAAVVEWTAGPVYNTMSFRRWTFVLEAIGDSPDWTIEESS